MTEGDKKALERIAYEENEGFPAIGGLVELFEIYENNRKQHPDIESFMPNIKKYFESYLM